MSLGDTVTVRVLETYTEKELAEMAAQTEAGLEEWNKPKRRTLREEVARWKRRYEDAYNQRNANLEMAQTLVRLLDAERETVTELRKLVERVSRLRERGLDIPPETLRQVMDNPWFDPDEEQG